MLEPRPSGDSIGIEPIRFHLQELQIELPDLFRSNRTGGEPLFHSFAQFVSRILEIGDALVQLLQFQLVVVNLAPQL